MNTDLMFSSKTDDWATPQEFFDSLNAEFGFTLDAAADDSNHKCDIYFTKKENGLSKKWGGCYMVQSSVWARNRPVGQKSVSGEQSRKPCGYAYPRENGHRVVSRLCFEQSGNPFCSWPAEIRRCKERRAFSFHGVHIPSGS